MRSHNLIFVLTLFIVVTISADIHAQSQYSISYSYINNYPKGRENGWSSNLQGVTHDRNNWFITQTKTLWKFPVEHDLNKKETKADLRRGILKVGIPKTLKDEGYNHFGDLDHYEGYLFVPLTGKRTPRVAVFRANDLTYMGSALLARQSSGAGWCAINPVDGLLYSSNNHASSLSRYAVDLEKLGDHRLLVYKDEFPLFDESVGLMELRHMQGGVFSSTGLLYLVHGFHSNCDENKCGIKVFDGKTGKLVAQSTNGHGQFNYEFHTKHSQEPEGITIWDLDDVRAPNIKGQLHVIMLENDFWSKDDFFFKHYRINAGPLPKPTQLSPTNGEALSNYPRHTTLSWAPVPGAVSYTIEVQYKDGNTWRSLSSESSTNTTSYSFNFIGAQPGRWRVWAVGEYGQKSPETGWWEFRYTQ